MFCLHAARTSKHFFQKKCSTLILVIYIYLVIWKLLFWYLCCNRYSWSDLLSRESISMWSASNEGILK